MDPRIVALVDLAAAARCEAAGNYRTATRARLSGGRLLAMVARAEELEARGRAKEARRLARRAARKAAFFHVVP